MQDFNEATRVQIPGLVHLARIGYTYFGKISEEDAGTVYDPDTNILLDVFKKKFGELNPGHEGLFNQTLQEIRQELDYNDLGAVQRMADPVTEIFPVFSSLGAHSMVEEEDVRINTSLG